MVLDNQFVSDCKINDNIVDQFIPFSALIPRPINPLQCTRCQKIFDNELELSAHKTQFIRYAINRVMMKNQNETIQLPTFIQPSTPQISQSDFSYHMGTPPSSHPSLFSMLGSERYNNGLWDYFPSDVPISLPPPHHENNIDDSFERTMDLLALIDKPMDLFGNGNNDNNDIDLNLKL